MSSLDSTSLPNDPKWTLAQRYEDVTVCLDYERSRTSQIVRQGPVRDLDECQGATNASLRRLYADIEATIQSFVSPAVLREHWLTGIECDEAARTDTATCFCATWRSEPKATVAEAVDAWIEHVFGAEHDREVPECVEIGPDGRAYVIGLPGDDHNCDSMRCPSASAHTLYVLPVEPAEQANGDVEPGAFDAWYEKTYTEQARKRGDRDECDGRAFSKFDLKLAFYRGPIPMMKSDDSDPRCGDAYHAFKLKCYLSAGHPGAHLAETGHQWPSEAALNG